MVFGGSRLIRPCDGIPAAFATALAESTKKPRLLSVFSDPAKVSGVKMGKPVKRSRKAEDSDSDFDDYHDMDNEMMEQDEEDYDDDDEEGTDEEDETGEQGGRKNDNHKVAEMEELEKEYMDLRHQQQDTLKNLIRHKDEDALKGQAVKNQKALWYKILELRFLLQKPFSSSNRLPQEPVRSSLCDSNEGVSIAYSDLISSTKETLDSILELQEVMLAKNPSIAQTTDGSERSSKHLDNYVDEEWSRISETHRRMAAFRDKSINKWQRMTQVTTGAAAIKGKLHAFNQDISEQVAAYMRDPSRMIKQMRLRRSAINIFGSVPAVKDNTKEEEGHDDDDSELLDDSEFYQQLLKEFFETVDLKSSETALYALKRLRTKKRKIVDRRASKSRKIRYNVHEKIVNFMASEPRNDPDMASKLFQNLFGLKTQRPLAAT
ncbi:hypothetical protein L6164_000669 [Bauhinia variegata]|uniref:Uncharacterized protein n=1 Tax=Bauhinia variegata TaxID=167791 RepID=A0ACB9Q6S3_BAUVA|nr:hypothetical protein L6164_000669 [Bauhinia variegata]